MAAGVSYLLIFYNGRKYFERERAERDENTQTNKVCKFKLYYSRKFRVLTLTKMPLYNSKPRDVIKLRESLNASTSSVYLKRKNGLSLRLRECKYCIPSLSNVHL